MMIRNFENGDIVTSGEQFLYGAESVGAGVKHRLRMFFGEYFLDITDGTPWFQGVLGKAAQDEAEAVIKERIIGSPGVYALTRFEFNSDRSGRSIRVDADIITTNGETETIILDEAIA